MEKLKLFCPKCGDSYNIGKNQGTYVYNCDTCTYYELLKPNTKIYQNNYSGNDYIKKNNHNEQILPIVKNYVCSNKECKTHEDKTLKKAVFIADRINQKTSIICKICNTQTIY